MMQMTSAPIFSSSQPDLRSNPRCAPGLRCSSWPLRTCRRTSWWTSMAASRLRGSFSASKIRIMSIPFSMDFFTKTVDHVVGIVLVAQHVLAAEQHLQLGVGQTPCAACAGAPTGLRSGSACRSRKSRRPSTPENNSRSCPAFQHAGSISSVRMRVAAWD